LTDREATQSDLNLEEEEEEKKVADYRENSLVNTNGTFRHVKTWVVFSDNKIGI
jgi:hypothetical protein